MPKEHKPYHPSFWVKANIDFMEKEPKGAQAGVCLLWLSSNEGGGVSSNQSEGVSPKNKGGKVFLNKGGGVFLNDGGGVS